MDNDILRILFLGDLTGRPGRLAVKSFISDVSDKYDFVIANIENASHGFGLTKKNYDELSLAGIDCFTSGNHIWDKKDVQEYISNADRLVRPINYPQDTIGEGCKIFNVNGMKIAVINVLGRTFMPPIDSPWEIVTQKINDLKKEGVDSIFIDFHAEATAEKICFAKYISAKFNTEEKALIKGFLGTHTHVQTADEQIINGMGYITDAGFCGSTDGVIGMEFSTSLKRLQTSMPERYEVAGGNLYQVNGVEMLLNKNFTTDIKRINIMIDYNKDKEEKEADLDF